MQRYVVSCLLLSVGMGRPSSSLRERAMAGVLDYNLDVLRLRIKRRLGDVAGAVLQRSPLDRERDGVFGLVEVSRDAQRREAVGRGIDVDAEHVARLHIVPQLEANTRRIDRLNGKFSRVLDLLD